MVEEKKTSDGTTEDGEEKAVIPPERAALSDHYDALKEALDILYIPANASGRNKFREKWPEVAQYLFGDELIKYDNEGAEDLERRAQLEDDAAQKRILLKATMEDMLQKSVESGVLQFEYIERVVKEFDKMSIYLYAQNVIARVRPDFVEAGTEAEKSEADGEEVANAPASAPDLEAEPLSAPPLESAPAKEPVPPPAAPPPLEVPSDGPDEKLSAEEQNILSNSDEQEALVQRSSAPPAPEPVPQEELPRQVIEFSQQGDSTDPDDFKTAAVEENLASPPAMPKDTKLELDDSANAPEDKKPQDAKSDGSEELDGNKDAPSSL